MSELKTLNAISKATMISVTKYDIQIADQFLSEIDSDKDPDSFNYWVGFKAAKQQDLDRLKRLTDEV